MYLKSDLYIDCLRRICTNDFKSLRDTSFLITGASGLIGSFMVDFLMYLNKVYSLNIIIYCTFTSEFTYQNRFKSYLTNSCFIPIFCDITKSIPEIRFDYAIHCAANTHPSLYANAPVETIKLNLEGTIKIIELAEQSHARLVYLSSSEVYGDALEHIDYFSESTVGFVNFNNPRSCYPESKRLAETLCHSFVKEYGTDIVIARLGYIFGPTVKSNTSKADVQFLINALHHQNIVLKSDGLQRRSYLFVADAVAALLKLMIDGKKDEIYNIAPPLSESIRLRDFAEELAHIANVEVEFGVEGEVEKHGGSKVRNSVMDPSKLIKLGWSPKFSLHEALKMTYQIKRTCNTLGLV